MTRYLAFLVLTVFLCVISGVTACGLKCTRDRFRAYTYYTMKLNCSLFCYDGYSTSDSNYTWYKFFPGVGYQPAAQDPNIMIKESGTVLRFKSFTFDSLADDYMCQIKNTKFKYYPVIYHLRKPLIIQTNTDIESITYTSPEFSYMEMNCTFQGELVGNDFRFSWTKFIDGIPYKFPNDTDRVYMDVTGALHFTPVLKSDEEVDGKPLSYRCDVSSKRMATTVFGKLAYLKVTKGERHWMIPHLRYKSSHVMTNLNCDAVLECVFFGDHNSTSTTYLWDSAQGPITNGLLGKYKLLFQGKRLVVKNVQKCDQGVFKCMAHNGFGLSDSHIMKIVLNCSHYYL